MRRAGGAATVSAVKGLPKDLRAAVRSIGLSGQMHGATLLDARDQPLRPAILWNDGRSALECVELEQREPRSRAITGNLMMPGFTAPKLLWVAKHEPEVFARTAHVLLPKDYVRLKLTGEKASDMSDASGTAWLDVGRRDWSEAMLAATGLTRSHMPRLVEGTEPSGICHRCRCGPTCRFLGLSLPAAAVTTRPAPSVWVSYRPARHSCRWAPRACCSW